MNNSICSGLNFWHNPRSPHHPTKIEASLHQLFMPPNKTNAPANFTYPGSDLVYIAGTVTPTGEESLGFSGGGGGTGGTAGTEYNEGENPTTPRGQVIFAEMPDGAFRMFRLTADGRLRAEIIGNVLVDNAFALDATALAIRDRLPGTIGGKPSAQSLGVTLAEDGIFATAFGKASDGVAISDTAGTGFVSLFKRLLTRFTSFFEGTAGTPNTNVVTVQGIPNASPITINNALAPENGISNSRTITTANVFEVLTTARALKSGITVQSATVNTGLVIVRYAGSPDGLALTPGNREFFAINNTNQIEVSVAVAGERVRWMGS